MAKAVITIEDTDLDSGMVRSTIEVSETRMDDGHVTAAHFYAGFIKMKMRDPKFLAEMWDYAAELMNQNPGGRIMNPDQKIESPADDEAQAA